MPLYRLLYRSEFSLNDAAGPISQQIDAIVVAAAQANQRNDLSGALIASNGVFIQALEGSLTPLEQTFEKICSDLRHSRVRLVEFAAAEERIFPEWKMVRVEEREQVVDLCGYLSGENTGQLDLSKTGNILTMMRGILLSKIVPYDSLSKAS